MSGRLKKGGTIVEGTGGNTGIALAQLGTHTLSLTHSLSHCLTHLLADSLTLTHLLTHSHTHSLTHILPHCPAAGRAQGYRVVLCMPESISQEKIDHMRRLGAEVHVQPLVPLSSPLHYQKVCSSNGV